MSDHRRNSTATGKWTEMIWTPHRTEDNVTHALSLLTLFNSAFFSLSEGKCGCPGLLNPKFKRRGRRSVVCSLCVTFTPLQQRSCEGLQKENVNLWHLSLSECEPFVYILDFRLKKKIKKNPTICVEEKPLSDVIFVPKYAKIHFSNVLTSIQIKSLFNYQRKGCELPLSSPDNVLLETLKAS